MAEKKLKVSVCVITYNQEKYIGQCLDSILGQETDFDFEVIVGDDASTDRTQEILREYAQRYPEIVRPLFQDKNTGGERNYFDVHNAARGDYVAHVDGDDYALPGKLAALANHLDANSDCAIVWHRMYIRNELDQYVEGMPRIPIEKIIGKKKLWVKDLALYYGLTGCHSGSMYRNSCWSSGVPPRISLDYNVTLSLCGTEYCAMYIEECYGVYRYILSDKTRITASKGNSLVGRAKLDTMREQLNLNPDLKSAFAAQCVFEMLLRGYFRYPMVWDYFKMWIRCGVFFSPKSLWLVMKVFSANRNKKMAAALQARGGKP